MGKIVNELFVTTDKMTDTLSLCKRLHAIIPPDELFQDVFMDKQLDDGIIWEILRRVSMWKSCQC